MKAFIFDLDGVIVFTDKFHYQAWKKMADGMGIYFDEVKMDYNTFRLLIDRIGEPVYRESLRKMLDLSPFAKEDKAIKRQIEELEAAQRELQEKISKLKETEGED